LGEPLEPVRVTLEGDRLQPDALPLRLLTGLLTKYEELLLLIAFKDDPPHDAQMSLRLVGVGTGSVTVDCVGPPQIVSTPMPFLWDRTVTKHPLQFPRAERCYIKLSDMLERSGLSLTVSDYARPPITIAPDKSSAHVKPDHDETTVYGICRTVGGDPPRATMSVDGQQRPARVYLASKEQAKTLAQSLYGAVGIDGEASRDAVTGDVLSIRAERVFALREDSPKQVLEWFQQNAGPAWNAVEDPDKLLMELRGE